jgi:hypothetical protein
MNARLGARDVNGRPDRGNDIYASWERFFTSGQSGGIDFIRGKTITGDTLGQRYPALTYQ